MKSSIQIQTFVILLISACSFSLFLAADADVQRSTAISNKVKCIATAVRLRDQGAYKEALEVLAQFRSQSPNDKNVNDLYFKIRSSYDTIAGNRADSRSSFEVDALIDNVISTKADQVMNLDEYLSSTKKNLDKGNLNAATSLITRAKNEIWVTSDNRESYTELLDLEKRMWLEKALHDAQNGESELASSWLAKYQSDPSAIRSLNRLSAKVSDAIHSGVDESQTLTSEYEYVSLAGYEKELFFKGRAQYLGGDYQGALATFQEMEKRNPESSEAKEYQLKIHQYFNSNSYLNRLNTRQEMLNEVDRSWQRPRIFSPDTNRLEGENTANPLVAKIRNIKIPRVNFSNLELTAVIETLSELSVEFDTQEKDPLKKGVNIVPLFDPNTRNNPRVSISLRNLSLEKILQFVTQQVNFQFDTVEEAVVVQPTDGPDGAANLLTEFFSVSRATVIRLTGGASSASSQVFSDNPF